MERIIKSQVSEVNDRVEGLVSRAQNGEKDAFTLLYQEYVTPIYRYIYFRVGQADQTEDLTQEVFLRVLKKIGSYRYKGKSFKGWLFRIAHNVVIDHYRQTKKNRIIPLTESITVLTNEDPAAMTEQRMEMLDVKQAIEKLPPRQKEVISLRFGSDLSIAETARAIGKTEGNVKKLQFEAIIKLRTLMGK
jgi:RNA polymerase sigma-70 factor (ECF subfamily)